MGLCKNSFLVFTHLQKIYYWLCEKAEGLFTQPHAATYSLEKSLLPPDFAINFVSLMMIS